MERDDERYPRNPAGPRRSAQSRWQERPSDGRNRGADQARDSRASRRGSQLWPDQARALDVAPTRANSQPDERIDEQETVNWSDDPPRRSRSNPGRERSTRHYDERDDDRARDRYDERDDDRYARRSGERRGRRAAAEDDWRPARRGTDDLGRASRRFPSDDRDRDDGWSRDRQAERTRAWEPSRNGGRRMDVEGRASAGASSGRARAARWDSPAATPSGGRKSGKSRLPMSPRRRAVMITLVVAISLCTLSSLVTGILAATTGASAYSQATAGLAHLKKGEALLTNLSSSGFSIATVQQARGEFAAGQGDFQQVSATMSHIPGGLDGTPFVGRDLGALRNLSSLANNFSQIGVTSCDALAIVLGALSNPFGSAGSKPTNNTGDKSAPPPTAGLTKDDLTTIQAKLNTVNSLLNASTDQINALQPGDLSFDPKVSAQLLKVKAELPAIKGYIQDAQAILGVAGPLLGVGAPTDYLVELLDSTELRPGGGFIGNVGTLTLQNAIMAGLHVKDVDLIDRPFEFAPGFIPIPFPSQYQWFPFGPGWSLRDSNLDADFPTDARNAQKLYTQEGGLGTFQGVISITPWIIEKAIGITGSIYVPEFKETVTSTNLADLIHLHQLGPGHGSDYVPDPASLSSARKKFTAYLFVHFMDKVKSLLATKRGQFVKLAISAFATKDVQIYFNNPVAEGILQKHHLGSTVESPTAGDSVFVVDANIIANKANNFITYNMVDKVTIDKSGTATHVMTLTYNWPDTAASAANDYGSKYFYRDYVRVYAPPTATLISQSGWNFVGQKSAFGRAVFAGVLSFWFGGGQTISLTWKVPDAAVKSGDTWTYTELVQHQAGNTWTASMKVSLPSCGKVATVTAPWVVGADNTSATFKAQLTEDKTYATTYTCAS